ncbi:MAG: phosphoribosyltransferase family protein [Gammaproteobacteria bacterium]|jgi:hypoxanthine phosphoribosyltransferase|nr:phosphoribosyltransferase family protein [Gammaproteobacteria bacterium]
MAGEVVKLPPGAQELVSSARVDAGFDALAADLGPLVAAGNAVLLGVMNGGLVPLVRLIDRLQGDYSVSYCHVTRYRGQTSGGALEWIRRPADEVRGRHVIVVDDVFDAGLTLQDVRHACLEAGAARVTTAVAFVKEVPRDAGIAPPDFTTGLTLPNRYVFGCGMDLHNRWRQLRGIYALRPESG